MTPIMQPGTGRAPMDLPPHLIVKLKRGWRYDVPRGVFVSSGGQDLSPEKDLPPDSRVEYMVPQLAQVDPQSLGEDELDLARYLHLFLPKPAAAADYLAAVRRWKCVEQVQLPPEIGLPQ